MNEERCHEHDHVDTVHLPALARLAADKGKLPACPASLDPETLSADVMADWRRQQLT